MSFSSIAVFCGSSDAVHAEYKAGARALGRLLGERGIEVVYGGGRVGLMGALADGARGTASRQAPLGAKLVRASAARQPTSAA